MMYKIKYTTLLLSFLCMCTFSFAQQVDEASVVTIKGIVYDADTKQVMPNVQISSDQAIGASYSNDKGEYVIRLRTASTVLRYFRAGYFSIYEPTLERDKIDVYLQSGSRTMQTDAYSTLDEKVDLSDKIGIASAIDKKDFSDTYSKTGDAIAGRFAGMRVQNKSGMNGEGSLINLRGIRSLYSQNTPVFIVDGVPLRGDQNISNVINGFSRDIADVVNLREIKSISFLHGADALPYGSLGSNGVVVIETDEGIANETQVEVRTTQGISFIAKRLPMMEASDFTKYISEIAATRYADPDERFQKFPYLNNTLDEFQQLTYGYNTDWQKEIYTAALTSDNMLKVRGGDAVVRYMLTAGYQVNDGVVDGTGANKFYTRGNTNINFNDKLTANASVVFDYADITVFEQGMVSQSNPLLAAYAFSPLVSPYKYNQDLVYSADYTQVDEEMGASNPAAIKTETEGFVKRYDMLINVGVDYKFNQKLGADLKFGIVYSYTKEDMFIGGKTTKAVAPLMGGLAENTVRSGSTESKGYYGRASAYYNNTYNGKHDVGVRLGWQIMSNVEEASSGSGINTSADRFRNLNMDQISATGRSSTGYVEVWNWTNAYLTANYTYNKQLFAKATAMVDAASTYGDYSDRFFLFPAVQVGWKMDNAPFLCNNNNLNNLMVRAEYSINPNSRYNSRYGKYYYVLQMIRDISSLVRAGVPNRYIEPEKVHNINVGADFSTIGDRFNVSVDLFEEHTKDMLVETTISPAFGFNTQFQNTGAIRTRGAELSASVLVMNTPGFRWRVGGNIGHYKSEIMSLGKGVKEQILELDNGVMLINRVGESPYAFYGNRANGVFSSTVEAQASGLVNYGGYEFRGGDVRFVDRTGDNIISDEDRELLGSADPKFYGGFHSKFNIKDFTVFMNFTYSYGNKAYNAVRRQNESGFNITNQALSMSRRWVREGQITDIPRITYVDDAGNNRFSSRWIEDASYLKLKEISVSYDINEKFLIFNSFRVFVSAENLLTLTKYKGSDPEFAYSYDVEMFGMDLAKVPTPRFVKIGLVLNF